MSKIQNAKLLPVFGLVILFTVTVFSNMAAGQGGAFSEIEGKVAGITEKQRETIQKLFTQTQQIEKMEKRESDISLQIEKSRKDIASLQKALAGEEAAYANGRESLKQVLRSYQRMGPGSYLEILLKSESLPDLLMRINTLRDLTHDTGDLLDRLKVSSARLSAEKSELAEKLSSVEDEQKKLLQALAEEKKLKQDLESYLESLAEEREYYEGYLNNLQQAWGETKLFFSNTATELSGYTKRSSLPTDALKITYDFLSIRVSMEDKELNKIFAGDPELNKVEFSFHPGKVEINIPEKNLVLSGKFIITDGHGLQFEAEEGSFFGLPLEKQAINDMLRESPLILDFESELNGLSFKSIEVMEGYLNLSIQL